jgi:hypothetical protein
MGRGFSDDCPRDSAMARWSFYATINLTRDESVTQMMSTYPSVTKFDVEGAPVPL